MLTVHVEQSVIRHAAKGFMYGVKVGVVTSEVPSILRFESYHDYEVEAHKNKV